MCITYTDIVYLFKEYFSYVGRVFLNNILCITKEKLEPLSLSQLEVQTDACRKHPGKPADAICTSTSRLFEPARQGEAEAHKSRATDAKDVG